MRITWKRVAAMTSLLGLMLFMTAAPIAAAPNGNGNGDGDGHGRGHAPDPPGLSATPELDSLALFGAGAAGMASYALLRLRASRRRDREVD